MLSGEGMQRRKTVKNNNRSNQQKQLCTCSTLFCTFLCRCFARLQRETSRNFLVTRFMEEMSYEFPFTFIRSRSFSPCNGGLSKFNMASLEDRRIDQCEKLFDSTVSNPDHKLHHFLPPKNYCHYNLRGQRHFANPVMRTKRFSSTFLPSMCRRQQLLYKV